ncbi:unnamed protein product, partial [Rotaria magnacalcarata]
NTRALSGIYSTIVNFTVHDFLRRAQRLSLLNEIKCKQLQNGSVDNLVFPIHYKHRVERQSSFTHSQREIDEIDIEQHNYSSQICNLNDEVFEIDDDNEEDETTNDLNMNEDNDDSSVNNDSTDEDEQNNARDLITTTKKDFSGVKVADKVQPHIEHTYFKVKLNHDTKFLHKQTACWLLTEDKSDEKQNQYTSVLYIYNILEVLYRVSNDFTGLHWTPLDSTGLHWTPLDSIGLHWTPLDSIGLHWTPLDSIGLHWTPLDWSPLFPPCVTCTLTMIYFVLMC